MTNGDPAIHRAGSARRLVLLGLAEAFALLAVWQVVMGGTSSLGIDYGLYMRDAQRFLSTGTPYAPWQLSGPYELRGEIFLYPPVTLGLLIPFVFLPAVLWWAVPLTILAGTMIRWRPAAWAWPLIMLAVAWPRTTGALVTGNTDLWVAAAVALGLTSGWPAALILLKPTAFPLMLVGLRAWRPFALAVGFIVVAEVILLPLWGQYLLAVRNVAVGPNVLYSLPSLPLLGLPVIAWVARTRDRPTTGPRRFLATLVAAVRRRMSLRVRS